MSPREEEGTSQMNDRDRELTGPIDRAIRTVQGTMGGMEQRAARPIALAAAAFDVAPARLRAPVAPNLAGLPFVDLSWNRYARKLRSYASPTPGPSTPRPWIVGYVLYDEYSEELHEFIRRYLRLLDEATADRVLLVFVGNPEECGPLYRVLRGPTLRKMDEASTKVYQAKLARVGGDHLRRVEVANLRQGLEVSGDDVPCIVFFTGRPRGPRALLKIQPEWISDAEAQRQLARALVEFFGNHEIERQLGAYRTKAERILKYGELINEHVASRFGAVGGHEATRRPILSLLEINDGERNRDYVARIAGTVRFDGVNKKIGRRECFFISLLFDSKITLELHGQTLTVVSEERVLEAYKEWCEKERLQPATEAKPAYRVQKNWREFVRQMEKVERLKGLFTIVKPDGRRKFYAVRLGQTEIMNRVSNISAVSPKEQTAG
jgi:hypothetical protein